VRFLAAAGLTRARRSAIPISQGIPRHRSAQPAVEDRAGWHPACHIVSAVNPRRIRVAVWLSSFDAGGTERQMVRLIAALDPARFETHACCFAARGPWLSVGRERAASIAEFPIAGFTRASTWAATRRFAGWCRDRDIQVVLTSDFYTNVFALPGAAWAGVPVRLGGRRELVTDKTPAKLLLQRAAYAAAHRIVANSQAAADLLRAERVPARRIAVVPNGIEVGARPPRDRSRPLRRAITVANLRPEKGHDVLIDAVAARGREWPDLEFQIVGDGPCRRSLEERARVRGVSGRFHFAGERLDVLSLLSEADLFVLPSRTEALSNAVMEAMAAGLPVIATGVGGTPELIEDGVSGWLVAPGAPDALGDAISAALADPGRAAAMGRAARARIETRYSVGAMVSGFSQLFLSEFHRRTSAAVRPEAARVAAPE
jgi:glycosyltransferase involved in cell wall biosynthesis